MEQFLCQSRKIMKNWELYNSVIQGSTEKKNHSEILKCIIVAINTFDL